MSPAVTCWSTFRSLLYFSPGCDARSRASPASRCISRFRMRSRMLAGSGLWDVLYQHVHYFTPKSLSALFRRAGFELIGTGSAFFDQHLSIEARTGDGIHADAAQASPSQFGISRLIAGFHQRFHQTVARWSAPAAQVDLRQEARRAVGCRRQGRYLFERGSGCAADRFRRRPESSQAGYVCSGDGPAHFRPGGAGAESSRAGHYSESRVRGGDPGDARRSRSFCSGGERS